MKRLSAHNLLVSLSNTLLSASWQGFGGILLLFALCFLGVHLTKLVVGDRQFPREKSAKTNSEPIEKAPETKKDDKPSQSEPIYYIVEKKRRRSKPSYGEPKEFRFK